MIAGYNSEIDFVCSRLIGLEHFCLFRNREGFQLLFAICSSVDCFRMQGNESWMTNLINAKLFLLIKLNGKPGGNNVKNIEMTTEGDILTIKVDLSQRFGKSSSGKSTIIASTEGNQAVPGKEEIKIGLNIYTK